MIDMSLMQNNEDTSTRPTEYRAMIIITHALRLTSNSLNLPAATPLPKSNFVFPFLETTTSLFEPPCPYPRPANTSENLLTFPTPPTASPPVVCATTLVVCSATAGNENRLCRRAVFSRLGGDDDTEWPSLAVPLALTFDLVSPSSSLSVRVMDDPAKSAPSFLPSPSSLFSHIS